jgi:hypothetical protein
VKERELEDQLISRLQAFLLELGYGFCFVGRQHHLALRGKEYFIDLLFYHRFLKALVAFELKGRLPTARQLAAVVRAAMPQKRERQGVKAQLIRRIADHTDEG